MSASLNDGRVKPSSSSINPQSRLPIAQSRYACSNPFDGGRLSPILASGSGSAPRSSSLPGPSFRSTDTSEIFAKYFQQQEEITAAIEHVTATAREANQQVKAFDELAAEYDQLKTRLSQNERLIVNLYKYLFDSGLPADQLIVLGQIVEQTDRRLFRKCLAFVQGSGRNEKGVRGGGRTG